MTPTSPLTSLTALGASLRKFAQGCTPASAQRTMSGFGGTAEVAFQSRQGSF